MQKKMADDWSEVTQYIMTFQKLNASESFELRNKHVFKISAWCLQVAKKKKFKCLGYESIEFL